MDEIIVIPVVQASQCNECSSFCDNLMEKAKDIAKERKLEDFVLSSGWIDRFKKPKEILFQAICNESASLDSAQTDEWPKDTL